ncbi:hypothetical protein DFJ77DRAFT_471589 [Powellomyces hirtus]|nr:hypothetical protein DFJ77DRAFT_471589 [Powellomyces hirtus]
MTQRNKEFSTLNSDASPSRWFSLPPRTRAGQRRLRSPTGSKSKGPASKAPNDFFDMTAHTPSKGKGTKHIVNEKQSHLRTPSNNRKEEVILLDSDDDDDRSVAGAVSSLRTPVREEDTLTAEIPKVRRAPGTYARRGGKFRSSDRPVVVDTTPHSSGHPAQSLADQPRRVARRGGVFKGLSRLQSSSSSPSPSLNAGSQDADVRSTATIVVPEVSPPRTSMAAPEKLFPQPPLGAFVVVLSESERQGVAVGSSKVVRHAEVVLGPGPLTGDATIISSSPTPQTSENQATEVTETLVDTDLAPLIGLDHMEAEAEHSALHQKIDPEIDRSHGDADSESVTQARNHELGSREAVELEIASYIDYPTQLPDNYIAENDDRMGTFEEDREPLAQASGEVSSSIRAESESSAMHIPDMSKKEAHSGETERSTDTQETGKVSLSLHVSDADEVETTQVSASPNAGPGSVALDLHMSISRTPESTLPDIEFKDLGSAESSAIWADLDPTTLLEQTYMHMACGWDDRHGLFEESNYWLKEQDEPTDTTPVTAPDTGATSESPFDPMDRTPVIAPEAGPLSDSPLNAEKPALPSALNGRSSHDRAHDASSDTLTASSPPSSTTKLGVVDTGNCDAGVTGTHEAPPNVPESASAETAPAVDEYADVLDHPPTDPANASLVSVQTVEAKDPLPMNAHSEAANGDIRKPPGHKNVMQKYFAKRSKELPPSPPHSHRAAQESLSNGELLPNGLVQPTQDEDVTEVHEAADDARDEDLCLNDNSTDDPMTLSLPDLQVMKDICGSALTRTRSTTSSSPMSSDAMPAPKRRKLVRRANLKTSPNVKRPLAIAVSEDETLVEFNAPSSPPHLSFTVDAPASRDQPRLGGTQDGTDLVSFGGTGEPPLRPSYRFKSVAAHRQGFGRTSQLRFARIATEDVSGRSSRLLLASSHFVDQSEECNKRGAVVLVDVENRGWEDNFSDIARIVGDPDGTGPPRSHTRKDSANPANVRDLVFGPDGQVLFTAAAEDPLIKAWNASDGSQIKSVKLNVKKWNRRSRNLRNLGIQKLAVQRSDTACIVAGASFDGSLRMFFLEYGDQGWAFGNISPPMEVEEIAHSTEFRVATSVAFGLGPSDNIVMVGYERFRGSTGNGVVRLYDVSAEDHAISTLKVEDNAVACLAVSESGQSLAVGVAGNKALPFEPEGNFSEGGDGILRIFDIRNAGGSGRGPTAKYTTGQRKHTVVGYSPCERYVYSCSAQDNSHSNQHTLVYDVRNANTRLIVDAIQLEHRGSSYGATCATWTSAGLFLTGGQDDAVRVWDIRRGDPLLRVLRAHEGPVTAMALSPEEEWLAVGTTSGTVHLWSVEDSSKSG